MKKLLAVLLVLCLLPWVYAEDIDLSGLSFEELRALQNRIAEEIVTRPEWMEVAVPVGVYKIGVDIPAGDWCLRAGRVEKDHVNVSCSWTIDDTKTRLGSLLFYESIYIDGVADGIKRDSLNVTLLEGSYFEVERGWVIFTPPVRIDLGF